MNQQMCWMTFAHHHFAASFVLKIGKSVIIFNTNVNFMAVNTFSVEFLFSGYVVIM